MDTSKIKNFIIIILALTNAVLLVVSALESAKENALRKAAMEELTTLYESSGITLPEQLLIYETASAGCELTRDLELERKMVESILGRCSVSQQGGNIYVYSGAKGQASFRGTGEFEMLLNYGVANSDRGRVAASREILKKMGISPGEYSSETQDGEQYTVTLDCKYKESEVYNARVSFRFSGENLMIVSGKRVFDSEVESSTSETIDMGTALVRFLKEAGEKGYVCTVVTDISKGYAMSVAVSGECVLSPVWRIATDTGEYMLGAVTGKLETVAY